MEYKLTEEDEDIDKTCEASCEICTSACCDCGDCGTDEHVCSSTTKSKYSVSGTAEGEANWGIWKAKLGLSASYESETISSNTMTLTCTGCYKKEGYVGFKESTESWEYGCYCTCPVGDWICDDSASKMERTQSSSSSSSDCP